MKICFVLNNFVGTSFAGGGGKVSYRVIRKFADSGHCVDIICGSTTAPSYPGINKIIVVDKPYGKEPSQLETFFAEVRRLTEGQGYEAIVSDSITPYADISFLQYHSLAHRLRLHRLTGLFRMIGRAGRVRRYRSWAGRGPRRFIAVSRTIKDDYSANLCIPPDRIGVVYPGVDVTDVTSGGTSAGPPTSRTDGAFTFGFVATGFSSKGGYLFFRALASLARQGYRCKARIVYPQFERRPGMRLLAKVMGISDRIEFLPYQKNVKAFYGSLQCIVMPSLHEAFGLVALEAMANGLPVIVSDAAGASEIVQDGVNGLVFAMRGNAAGNLRRKMAYVLEHHDKVKEIARKGYATALERTWDRTYADFLREIESAQHHV
jgi:glycosyltransferase involved in cell wall biosynthesis